MRGHLDELDIPLFYVTRGFAGCILLLFCLISGFGALHFWNKSAAFEQGTQPATGTVLTITSRGCSFLDRCLDNQESVYTATVAFTDRAGANHRAEVDLRWVGRRVGDRIAIYYLSDDPAVAIAENPAFARWLWRLFQIQLGIGSLACGFAAIRLFWPGGESP